LLFPLVGWERGQIYFWPRFFLSAFFLLTGIFVYGIGY